MAASNTCTWFYRKDHYHDKEQDKHDEVLIDEANAVQDNYDEGHIETNKESVVEESMGEEKWRSAMSMMGMIIKRRKILMRKKKSKRMRMRLMFTLNP